MIGTVFLTGQLPPTSSDTIDKPRAQSTGTEKFADGSWPLCSAFPLQTTSRRTRVTDEPIAQ